MTPAEWTLAAWAALSALAFLGSLAHEAWEGKGMAAVWRWLTDPIYRQVNDKVRPVTAVWRCVWFPPAGLVFLALVVLLFVQYGPTAARHRWRDGP